MNTNIISYLLGKKAGSGGTINNQDKTVTQNGSYTADSGYTGLGTVTVNVPEPTGNINITDTNLTNVKNYATAQVVDADLVAGNIKKDVNILGIIGTYEGSGGGSIDWSAIGYSGTPQVITDGYDYAKEIYDNWDSTQTNLNNKYKNDYNLLFFPLVDTKNVTSFYYTFNNSNLICLPLLDTKNVTNFSNFINNTRVTVCPPFNTESMTSLDDMFRSSHIVTVPELNCEKVIFCNNPFSACSTPVNLGGFKDLGKAYLTTQSANYSSYRLVLNGQDLLTHDSLMNVINKLYDIATAGVQAQQLLLGSTNLAKLTASEIQIATDKGWSVS